MCEPRYKKNISYISYSLNIWKFKSFKDEALFITRRWKVCLNTGYSTTWQNNSHMTKYFYALALHRYLLFVIQGYFKYSGISTYSNQTRVVCDTGQWLAFSFIHLVQNMRDQVTANVISFSILWLTMPIQTPRGINTKKDKNI